MTMDLSGPGGDRSFNLTTWRLLLDLALRHGWRPAGVAKPEDEQEDEREPSIDMDPAHALPPESPLARAVASLLPADDPLLTSYFSNSGCVVTAADAAALAEALERALPDIPGHDAMGEKTFFLPSLPGVPLVRSTTPVNVFEWFSGKQELLRDFIRFCRAGGFEIG